MYSINDEGKYVAAERFIRTLKTKIYKYMTSVSKNVYVDKLDDIGSLVRTDIVLISSCLPEIWAGITVLTITDSLSLE